MQTKLPQYENLGDIVETLGSISPRRIRFSPLPGRATVRDLLRILDREDRLYELVDGTLVEKIVGAPESRIANLLSGKVIYHVEEHSLGYTYGADAPIRMFARLVRMPDLSFVSWKKRPDRTYPTDAIAREIPDLVAEVISRGNTRREMKRKLKEYFLAGVRVVWYVYPKKKKVRVYTAPDEMIELTEKDQLDGGDVLPGFVMELRSLFAASPEPAQKKSARNGH